MTDQDKRAAASDYSDAKEIAKQLRVMDDSFQFDAPFDGVIERAAELLEQPQPPTVTLPNINDAMVESFGGQINLIENSIRSGLQWTQEAVDFACALQGGYSIQGQKQPAEPRESYLPKITEQHLEDFGDFIRLIDNDCQDAPQWTQEAVDFACILKALPPRSAPETREPNTEGEVRTYPHVGPGAGAGTSVTGQTHGPELSLETEAPKCPNRIIVDQDDYRSCVLPRGHNGKCSDETTSGLGPNGECPICGGKFSCKPGCADGTDGPL